MKGFGSYHPAILFLYYVLALAFSMVSLHPVLVAVALIGSFFFYAMQKGVVKMLMDLWFFACLFLIMAVVNPIFVHNGETILFFMNGNPVTMEAVIYGGMAALAIVGVLMWCRCYTSILTTDKFLYLFGKLIPKLGLILSMAFRFIPLFSSQIKKIGQAQKTMGLFATDSVPDKVRGGVRIFDSLVSWSMENSIDTADAMKARGYGLPGRTNFSLFRFRQRDVILLCIMGGFSAVILACFASGGFSFYYYPYVAEIKTGAANIAQYLTVLAFMLIPGVIEAKEKVTWNFLKSKI
ncbi:energy-coupling factor transporter transmembrane component T [Lachnospiraceae bacterium LCP19S3_B12]